MDLSLLDEARRKSEEIIDLLHPVAGGKKPRTDRKQARIHFLSVIRKRKKDSAELRKAVQRQLGYLGRNLKAIKAMCGNQVVYGQGISPLTALSRRHYRNLLVIQELYRQQRLMLDQGVHKVADRIVSVSQPHVRPIIRGKARNDVEFGAKISVAVHDGKIFVDRMSFDAYSESTDVALQAEAYKRRTGYWPERILADKAYQNRENRQWCKERSIRLMGSKLGRPYEEPLVKKLFHKLERMEERERVEIEGRIGIQKRRYQWDLIKGKTSESARVMILLMALAANIAQELRDIIFNFIREFRGIRTINKTWLEISEIQMLPALISPRITI